MTCWIGKRIIVLCVCLRTLAGADRALILDYELNPPDFSNELIRRTAAAGVGVDYRQYYPVLTQADVARYRTIILLASAGQIGSGLQLDEREIPALTAYVKRGGRLVLGVPSDPEAFHQLEPYNRLLNALGSGIQVRPAIADDESRRYLSAMFPQSYFAPAPDTFAEHGVSSQLVLDRATILDVKSPAVALARTGPQAFAIVGLGRPKTSEPTPRRGFPIVALAGCGRGSVLVTARFNLNIGGFNGRVGVQPVARLDWIRNSDRFVQNILDAMLQPAPPAGKISDAELSLPAAPPESIRIISIEPRGAIEQRPAHPEAFRALYRAVVRRDLYDPYLAHGLRAAWGEVDRDDDWLGRLAAGFKSSGLNYIWGVGWPERLVSNQFSKEKRDALLHSWETFAGLLDGSPVGWSIGLNYPGAGFDRKRYERCRGVDGKPIEILSPLDLRLWNEMIIPELEEIAKFGTRHSSVKGATIDFEMYGYEPVIFYPEAVGFEDVAYRAFLRGAEGYVDADLLAQAARLAPEQRYTWLRDRGLLDTFYLILENESEKLGRIIRQRIHAIHPKFIFGAYQAGLPYSWFYRGLMRGLSTPAMPMIWMSFQSLSGADVDRFWTRGQHMLNAAALMLGTHPIAQWKDVMMTGRKFHDGYWLNRYTWLLDDAGGRKSIEIPDGSHEQAWQALREANRLIDENDRGR